MTVRIAFLFLFSLGFATSEIRAYSRIQDARRTPSNAETRLLVEQLVLERAAIVATMTKAANAREELLLLQLSTIEQRLRSERQATRGARAELDRVRTERATLVEQIGKRDRQFAATVAEYRRQIEDLANRADPQKREALARYANGDDRRAARGDALVAIR